MDGIHPHATEAEKSSLHSSMEQIGTAAVKDYLQQWINSGDVGKQMGAQQILGYMTLKGMLHSRQTGPERDVSGRIIPEKAPKNIHALLNANQKEKLLRLVERIKNLFSVDFFCRSEWPQFDGIFVNMNQFKNNQGGTGFKDPSLKKRDVTQINVLGASEEALQRFQEAFQPNIDDTQYEYFQTTDPKKFINRFKNAEETGDGH
jgi:hypothetical protein